MSSAKRLSTYQAGSGVKKRKINKAEANRAKKLEVQAKDDEWNEYYAQLIEYGMEHDSYQVPLDYTVKTDDGKLLQLGAWLQGSRLTEYSKHYPQWYSDIMDIVETGKLWFDPDLTKNVAAAQAKLQNKASPEPTPPAAQSSAPTKPPHAATKAILRDRAAGQSDSESDSDLSQVEQIAVPIPKVSAQAGPSKARASQEPPIASSVASKPASASSKGALAKKGVAVSSTSKESAGTSKTTVSSKSSKGVIVDFSHSDSDLEDSDFTAEVSEELSEDDYHLSRGSSAPARRSSASAPKAATNQVQKATASTVPRPSPYSTSAAKEVIRNSASASASASSSASRPRGRPPGNTTPSTASKPTAPAVTPSKDSASKEKQKQLSQAPPLAPPLAPHAPPRVPESMTRASSSSQRTPPTTQGAAEPALPPPKGITRPEQDPAYEHNGVFPPRRTIVKPRPVPPPPPAASEPALTPAEDLTLQEPTTSVSYKPVSVAAIKALTSALANTKQAGALEVNKTSAEAPAEPKIVVSTPSTSEPYIVLPPKQTLVESRPNGGSPRAYPTPQALYTDAKAGLQRRSIREAKQQSAPVPEDSQEYYFLEGRFADESKDTPPGHREETQDSQAAPPSPVPPLEAMEEPAAGFDFEMHDDDDLVVVGGRRGSPRGHVVKDSQTQSSQLEPTQLLLEDADGPTHQAFVAELCSPSSSSHLSTGTADTDSEDEVVQVSRAPTTTAAPTAQVTPAPAHTLQIVDHNHGGAVQSVTVTASQAQSLTSVSKIIQTADQHASASTSASSSAEAARVEMETIPSGPDAMIHDEGSSNTQRSDSIPVDATSTNTNLSTFARQEGNGQSVIDVPASLEEIIGEDSEDEDSDSDASDDGSVKIVGSSRCAADRNKEFVAFAYTRTTMGRDYAMLGIGMVCNHEADKDKLFLVVMRPSDPAHPDTAEYVMEFEENIVVETNVVLVRDLAFEGGGRGGVLDAPSQEKIKGLLRKYPMLQVDTHITAF